MPDDKDQQSKVEDFQKLQILAHEAEKQAEVRFRQKLLNIYAESAQDKERVAKNWDNYIAFLRGRQWPTRRPSHKVSALLNFMIENVERKTALLTDTKPIPKVSPRSDKLQDTADILNTLLSMIFESSSYTQARADIVENCQVMGSGFSGTLYNSDIDAGRGGIEVVSYDPRAVYIDPLVRKSYLLAEGEYVILEDIWSLEKARDMFPKRADMYQASAGLSRYGLAKKGGFLSGLRSRIFSSTQQQTKLSEVPRVYVREFYLRDRQKKDDSTQYRFNKASRRVVMIGDVIADDGSNPYNDGEFPIDMIAWHTDFDTAWGWGDVELLKSPQELINKITATIIENIALMSNAIWIGDQDALPKEEWNRLNNAPGSYVKKHPGRELRREPGVPLPAYVGQTVNSLELASEKMTGMVNVMQGISTGQVASGVGIESLQLMAQALIRLRARAQESMQERIGRKLISRIFQYYEPDKIFEVLKESEEQTSKTETIVALTSELLKPVARRKKEYWTDIAFKIEPGSSLGLAKTQRRVESMRLFELKAIDDEALLNDIEYPNRTKVLKRMDEKREAEGAAELAQNGQSGSAVSQFPHQAGASPQGRF